MESESLNYLFPVPSLPPSRLAPGHSPGVSSKSTEALQTVLKDNHVKWHIFFNDQRFHNHAAHRVIAAWALGAEADTIHKAYKRDCAAYEKPAIKSPGIISVDNFNEHLGDDRYFSAYVQFFVQHVKEHGAIPTIEGFVFSRKANLGSEGQESQPQMLNRFFAGALHPLIHVGYSVEFSLPGILAEGLAQMAVHHSVPGLLEPLKLFEDSSNVSVEGKVLPALPATEKDKDDPHALTILARVLRDPKFRPSSVDIQDPGYTKVVDQYSKDIASYINAWNVDPAVLKDGGWEKKVEEIAWTVVVLFGIGGWTYGHVKPKGFFADFFLMHQITSSIFLPSLCASISPVSCSRLLKTYLAVFCIWAIARGQPKLDVEGFVKATKRPADLVVDAIGAPQMDTQTSGDADLWDKVFETARVHQDEHTTKLVRSLAGWASVFGTRKARSFLPDKSPSSVRDEANCLPPTELPGSEYLDGGLFLRVALLAHRKVGWDFDKVKAEEGRDSENLAGVWDFLGFFESQG